MATTITRFHLGALLSVLAITGSGALSAATTPLPDWYPDPPNATRQGFNFTTSSTRALPEVFDNTFGAVEAVITHNPDSFGSGWLGPGSGLGGVDDDGVWDLDVGDSIITDVPIAAAPADPGTHYLVEFQVYVVAYEGGSLYQIPAFEAAINDVPLAALDPGYSQETIQPDILGSWEAATWTGSYDNVTADSITFALQPPGPGLSTIDTFEVFTRVTVIPEPSALILAALSLPCLLRRRRR